MGALSSHQGCRAYPGLNQDTRGARPAGVECAVELPAENAVLPEMIDGMGQGRQAHESVATGTRHESTGSIESPDPVGRRGQASACTRSAW
jgi:hypothetical protein